MTYLRALSVICMVVLDTFEHYCMGVGALLLCRVSVERSYPMQKKVQAFADDNFSSACHFAVSSPCCAQSQRLQHPLGACAGQDVHDGCVGGWLAKA